MKKNLRSPDPSSNRFPSQNDKASSYSDVKNEEAFRKFEEELELGENQLDSICSTHKRKIVAFCSRDKVVICVQCLLELHRNHEVKNIDAALEEEKKTLELSVKLLKPIEKRLRDVTEIISSSHQIFNQRASTISANIKEVYDQLIADIRQSEKLLQNYLKEFIQEENANLIEEATKIKKDLETITNIYSENLYAERTQSCNEILFNSKERFEFFSKLSKGVHPKIPSVPNIKKKKLMISLWKYIRVKQGLDPPSHISTPPGLHHPGRRELMNNFLDFLLLKGPYGMDQLIKERLTVIKEGEEAKLPEKNRVQSSERSVSKEKSADKQKEVNEQKKNGHIKSKSVVSLEKKPESPERLNVHKAPPNKARSATNSRSATPQRSHTPNANISNDKTHQENSKKTMTMTMTPDKIKIKSSAVKEHHRGRLEQIDKQLDIIDRKIKDGRSHSLEDQREIKRIISSDEEYEDDKEEKNFKNMVEEKRKKLRQEFKDEFESKGNKKKKDPKPKLTIEQREKKWEMMSKAYQDKKKQKMSEQQVPKNENISLRPKLKKNSFLDPNSEWIDKKEEQREEERKRAAEKKMKSLLYSENLRATKETVIGVENIKKQTKSAMKPEVSAKPNPTPLKSSKIANIPEGKPNTERQRKASPSPSIPKKAQLVSSELLHSQKESKDRTPKQKVVQPDVQKSQTQKSKPSPKVNNVLAGNDKAPSSAENIRSRSPPQNKKITGAPIMIESNNPVVVKRKRPQVLSEKSDNIKEQEKNPVTKQSEADELILHQKILDNRSFGDSGKGGFNILTELGRKSKEDGLKEVNLEEFISRLSEEDSSGYKESPMKNEETNHLMTNSNVNLKEMDPEFKIDGSKRNLDFDEHSLSSRSSSSKKFPKRNIFQLDHKEDEDNEEPTTDFFKNLNQQLSKEHQNLKKAIQAKEVDEGHSNKESPLDPRKLVLSHEQIRKNFSNNAEEERKKRDEEKELFFKNFQELKPVKKEKSIDPKLHELLLFIDEHNIDLNDGLADEIILLVESGIDNKQIKESLLEQAQDQQKKIPHGDKNREARLRQIRKELEDKFDDLSKPSLQKTHNTYSMQTTTTHYGYGEVDRRPNEHDFRMQGSPQKLESFQSPNKFEGFQGPNKFERFQRPFEEEKNENEKNMGNTLQQRISELKEMQKQVLEKEADDKHRGRGSLILSDKMGSSGSAHLESFDQALKEKIKNIMETENFKLEADEMNKSLKFDKPSSFEIRGNYTSVRREGDPSNDAKSYYLPEKFDQQVTYGYKLTGSSQTTTHQKKNAYSNEGNLRDDPYSDLYGAYKDQGPIVIKTTNERNSQNVELQADLFSSRIQNIIDEALNHDNPINDICVGNPVGNPEEQKACDINALLGKVQINAKNSCDSNCVPNSLADNNPKEDSKSSEFSFLGEGDTIVAEGREEDNDRKVLDEKIMEEKDLVIMDENIRIPENASPRFKKRDRGDSLTPAEMRSRKVFSFAKDQAPYLIENFELEGRKLFQEETSMSKIFLPRFKDTLTPDELLVLTNPENPFTKPPSRPKSDLLIFGGFSSSGLIEEEEAISERYNLERNFNQEAGPIHIYFNKSVCVLYQNVIYCLGGEENKRVTKNCLEINLEREGWWKSDIELEQAKIHFSAIVIEGKIFVAGGENWKGELLAECEVIDIHLKKGVRVSPLTKPRKDFVLISKENSSTIYALGGITNDEASTNTCETVTEESRGNWQKMPNMILSRCFFSACFAGKDLYCFGGRDLEGKMMNSVEKFDGVKWQLITPMISKRMWFVSLFYEEENTLWVFGGVGEGGEPVSAVEKYSLNTRTWVPARMMKQSRCGFYIINV